MDKTKPIVIDDAYLSRLRGDLIIDKYSPGLVDELLRLARLGLWAREHAKPALEKIRRETARECCCDSFSTKALAAFPKGTE